MKENNINNNDENIDNINPEDQKLTDESGISDNLEPEFVLDDKQIQETSEKRISLKEKIAQRKALKKDQKEEKKAIKKDQKDQKKLLKEEKIAKKLDARKNSNSRWMWFFILLLGGIIILFMWDNHRKSKFIKSKIKTADSLKYSEHFYKTKYQEKDSSLNLLLTNYNNLLEDNIENSEEITTNKKELLKLQKIVYLQDSILRQVKATFDVAMGGYAKDQVSVEMNNGKLYITMRNKLLFPSGSSNVQTSGMYVLKTLSKVLKNNSNIDIVVEGHTDNVPINKNSKLFKDNWDLSTARAVTVTRILTKKYNIRPERITSAGRSMFYPIAPNTTASGRAKNRRIEFILTPNLEELYKLTDTQLSTK